MIIKTYKNEQSYFNQQGYFRLCTNQVRPNKETSKFTRIKTSNVYHSLIDEMKDYFASLKEISKKHKPVFAMMIILFLQSI